MPKRNRIQKAALAITHGIGSPLSIIIHTVLFIVSFVAAWEGYIAFDHMLLILTTIVSLEAIYLSIFIQMTINYTTEAVEEVAEDVEEMQEDIGEIQEDVGELQEDVEDINEDETEEERLHAEQKKTLGDIQTDLRKLMQDIEKLRSR